MTFDLSPRPLLPPLPPPRPRYRVWLPLPYLLLLTFSLRWDTLRDTQGLIGAAAVALGAWLLGATTFRDSKSPYRMWTVGVVYCFCTSVFYSFGRAATPALIANLFFIAATYIAVAPRESHRWSVAEPAAWWRHWPVAGALLGAAVYWAPLALAWLVALAAYRGRYYRKRVDKQLRGPALRNLLAGAALPLLLSVYFAKTWRHVSFTGVAQLLELGKYVLFALPLLLLAAVGGLRSILSSSDGAFNQYTASTLWCCTLGVILIGGKTPYPLVVFHPALALLLAVLVTAQGPPNRGKRQGLPLLAVLALGLAVGYYQSS